MFIKLYKKMEHSITATANNYSSNIGKLNSALLRVLLYCRLRLWPLLPLFFLCALFLHFFAIRLLFSQLSLAGVLSVSVRAISLVWGSHADHVPFSYRQADFLHSFSTVLVGSQVGWSPFFKVSVLVFTLVLGSHSDQDPFS